MKGEHYDRCLQAHIVENFLKDTPVVMDPLLSEWSYEIPEILIMIFFLEPALQKMQPLKFTEILLPKK